MNAAFWMEKIRLVWKKKIEAVLNGKGLSKQIEKMGPKTAGIFFAFWFLAALLSGDFLLSVGIGIIGGIAGTVLLWRLPMLREKRRLEKAEAELPFVLLGISVELRLQRPFEKILEKAGHSDFRFAAFEFQKTTNEILVRGASVSEALLHFSERLSSSEAKRAVIQLVHAYEQGTKNRGLEVKRIANELLARQRIEAKAFSGKLALFSLVFIAVSAIAPALFQSFVLVGSTFLSMDWTPGQVLLITAAGFPLLDLLVLLLIRFKTPVFLR